MSKMLSVRQAELLDLFAQGLTAKEVASRAGLAGGTVRVCAGEIMRKLGARNMAHAVAMRSRGAGASLTPMQRRVLELLAEGNSYDEAAAVIGISRSTLGHHVTALLARTGARNTTHAAVMWARGEVPT